MQNCGGIEAGELAEGEVVEDIAFNELRRGGGSGRFDIVRRMRRENREVPGVDLEKEGPIVC